MPVSDLGFLVSEPLRRNGFDVAVLSADGSVVTLTSKDRRLLAALVRHRGQVLS